MPPADASPSQVLTAFLSASRADDETTGRGLAAEGCWDAHRGWFANKHDRLVTFTVSERTSNDLRPSDLSTRVRFSYTDASEQPQGGWEAELRRADATAPWRVCTLRPLSG